MELSEGASGLARPQTTLKVLGTPQQMESRAERAGSRQRTLPKSGAGSLDGSLPRALKGPQVHDLTGLHSQFWFSFILSSARHGCSHVPGPSLANLSQRDQATKV